MHVYVTTRRLSEMTRVFLSLTRGPMFKPKPWEYNNLKTHIVEICRL